MVFEPRSHTTRGTAFGALLVTMVFILAGACATEERVLTDCEVFEAQLLDCHGEVPTDFYERCEADLDLAAAVRGLDCEALEHAEHKLPGSAGLRLAGDPCFVNLECEGDLVCRVTPGEGQPEPRCATVGVHEAELAADRNCDPVTNADCAEGDRCLGIDGRDGTCESEMIGATCDCPYGDESCIGRDGGCGPDLGCIHSVCRRSCTSAVPGTCPNIYDVCAQIDHSRGYSLGSWCQAR